MAETYEQLVIDDELKEVLKDSNVFIDQELYFVKHDLICAIERIDWLMDVVNHGRDLRTDDDESECS